MSDKSKEVKSSPKFYICPFCTVKLASDPYPNFCDKCGNSLRDLELNEYDPNISFSDGLGKVTDFTRKQQIAIENRENWYKEEHNKVHPSTNATWDNEFATEYQRQNAMSVEESLQEIDEFRNLMNMDPFDEVKWKAFIDKYNARKQGRKVNLPVNEKFLEKLQEDRAKRDKEKHKNQKKGNGKDSVNAKTNSNSENFDEFDEIENRDKTKDTKVTIGGNKSNNAPPKSLFKPAENGKGKEVFNKYVQKKEAKRRDLFK